MNPWPWRRLRDFIYREKLAHLAKKAGAFPTIIALALSPIGLIAHIAAYWRWRSRNDNWYSRPLLLALIGIIGTAIVQLVHPEGFFGALRWALESLGRPEQIGAGITTWLLIGAFPALTLTAIQSAGFALAFELDNKVWTRETKPNLLHKFRAHRNTQKLRAGHTKVQDHVTFGIHYGDTLPWGNARHGAVVSKAFKKIGHGFILGQAGTGKTAEALNLADQFIHAGFSMAFPDFKGDSKTRKSLKASCEAAGTPFHAFSIKPFDDGEENIHFDPVDWEGSANDKAALIMKALPFPAEDSAASYYRTKAEAYLPLQFEVLDRVGLRPGEGTFDFLLATSEPLQLAERLAALRGGDATAKEEFTRLNSLIGTHNAKDLEGLKGNLAKVVNAGGKYLRPAPGTSKTFDLRAALDSGAVVYFDLPSTLDAVSSITMGTLLMQDVKAIIGQRSRDAGRDWRDVILMSDEASALGVRADVMDDISKQGRSAKIWNWVVTQSIGTWPETTMREVLNNATVRIVFNIQEGDSQVLLTDGMPESYYIEMRNGVDLGDGSLMSRRDKSDRQGSEKALMDKQLSPSDIGKLPNRRAWIWFSGTDEGVRLVQGRVRKRWLPVKDEAPSDVVVIKPVLHQRVADAIGDGSTDRDDAVVTQAPRPIPSAPGRVDTSTDDWTLEALPAPSEYMDAPYPEQVTAPRAAEEPGYGHGPDQDEDEAAAGSQPLSVTLARLNRKVAPAEPTPSTAPAAAPEAPANPSPAPDTPAKETSDADRPTAPAQTKRAAPKRAAPKANPLIAKPNPLMAKPAAPAPATDTPDQDPKPQAATEEPAEKSGPPKSAAGAPEPKEIKPPVHANPFA